MRRSDGATRWRGVPEGVCTHRLPSPFNLSDGHVGFKCSASRVIANVFGLEGTRRESECV
jgi:hypothetical protein